MVDRGTHRAIISFRALTADDADDADIRAANKIPMIANEKKIMSDRRYPRYLRLNRLTGLHCENPDFLHFFTTAREKHSTNRLGHASNTRKRKLEIYIQEVQNVIKK